VRLDSLNPRVVVFDLRAGSLCPRAETLSHLVSGPYLDILVVCGPGESFCECLNVGNCFGCSLNTTCFGSVVFRWKIPIGSAISLPNRNTPTPADYCERHTFYLLQDDMTTRPH
jgi:hypothetical protein